jgi:peptidoglycan hydrolase CwlO-like protein
MIKDIRERIDQLGGDNDAENADILFDIEFEVDTDSAPCVVDLNEVDIPDERVKQLQEAERDFRDKFDDILSDASDTDSVIGALDELICEVEENICKLDKSDQTGELKQ